MKKQHLSVSNFKTKKIKTTIINSVVGGKEKKKTEVPTNG